MTIEEGPTSKTCGDATGWTVLANQTAEGFYATPRSSWSNGVSAWAYTWEARST